MPANLPPEPSRDEILAKTGRKVLDGNQSPTREGGVKRAETRNSLLPVVPFRFRLVLVRERSGCLYPLWTSDAEACETLY